MKTPIHTLRNLGPMMERRLADIGIDSAEALRELGAVDAWRRLSFAFPDYLHRIALYAMAGALIDRDWRRLPPDLKAELDEAAAETRAARARISPSASRARRR